MDVAIVDHQPGSVSAAAGTQRDDRPGGQLLGVSRRTVYYRIREGRLRTIRTLGGSQRVLVESVDEALRSR